MKTAHTFSFMYHSKKILNNLWCSLIICENFTNVLKANEYLFNFLNTHKDVLHIKFQSFFNHILKTNAERKLALFYIKFFSERLYCSPVYGLYFHCISLLVVCS